MGRSAQWTPSRGRKSVHIGNPGLEPARLVNSRCVTATGLLSALALLLPLLTAAAPRKLVVDPKRSHIVAITGKGGLLRFLGHQHAIQATEWSADVAFDAEDPARSALRLRVQVRSLRIDTERAIALAGLTSRPSADTVQELQEKMLGPRFLDAAQFPEIVFESQAVESAGEGMLRVRGSLTLHGQTRPVTTVVRIARPDAASYRFSGEVMIKQTDYAVKPESIAGVVDVADAVVIRFDVTARPAGP
jgi:polyisoprenoid-binding protein YceI